MPRSEAARRPTELERVAQRVQELPHPVRSRLLLELASDVEQLTEELRRQGLSGDEAASRAAERVIPSEDAVRALVRLHRPLYRRLVAPLPDSVLRRWERRALAAVGVFALTAGVSLLASHDLMDAPSPFLWAVLALAAPVSVVATAKAFQLLVRGDHRSEVLDRGLGTLLALSGLAVLVACMGTLTDLWALAATLEAGPAAEAESLLIDWLLRETVLLSAGLLTATGGGLSWFLLTQRAAAIRGADQEVRQALRASPESAPSSEGSPSTLSLKEA